MSSRGRGVLTVHVAWQLVLLALVALISHRAGYLAGHRAALREVTAELRAILARHPK